MIRLNTILRDILKEEKEFIIWGVPPGERDEIVAYTKAKSMPEAKKVMDILKQKYGLTKLRVQVIDLSQEFDLKKAFGSTIKKEMSVTDKPEEEEAWLKQASPLIEADSPTERTRRYNRKNKKKVRAYLRKTQDDRVARNGDRAKAVKKHGKAKLDGKDVHHPNGPKNGNWRVVKGDHGPDKKD